MRLQSARDDFSPRSGALIDKDDHGPPGDSGVGLRLKVLDRFSPPRRCDPAVREEKTRHRDCAIEQAARIITQIENITLEPTSRRGLHLGDVRSQVTVRLLIEAGERDVADIFVNRRIDVTDKNFGARHCDDGPGCLPAES